MRWSLAVSIAVGLWLFAADSAAAPGAMIYSRPGQIVPAGDGARLNLYFLGTGSPTVVLESGFEDWAPAWAVVQPRIAQLTRVCSYDRSSNARQLFTGHSSEYIQFDQPDVVVDAVREVYEQSRQGAAS